MLIILTNVDVRIATKRGKPMFNPGDVFVDYNCRLSKKISFQVLSSDNDWTRISFRGSNEVPLSGSDKLYAFLDSTIVEVPTHLLLPEHQDNESFRHLLKR